MYLKSYTYSELLKKCKISEEKKEIHKKCCTSEWGIFIENDTDAWHVSYHAGGHVFRQTDRHKDKYTQGWSGINATKKTLSEI